jgi:hypothetical protein
VDLTLPETPTVAAFSDDLPVVGIVDSGVAAHPLLKGARVAAIAESDDVGTHDGYGLGTLVAGVEA